MHELTSATPSELLKSYADILAELRRREIVRTANAPAGDYAEWLCWKALGGTLAPNSEKSFDLKVGDRCDPRPALVGAKIQVKARVVSDKITPGQRQMSPFRSWDFDYAAMVQLSIADYSVVRAVLVPQDQVRAASTWVAHVNGARVHMRESLMTSEGSLDITELVMTAGASE